MRQPNRYLLNKTNTTKYTPEEELEIQEWCNENDIDPKLIEDVKFTARNMIVILKQN